MKLAWTHRPNGYSFAEHGGFRANVMGPHVSPPRTFDWWVAPTTGSRGGLSRAGVRGLRASGSCDKRATAIACARLVLECLAREAA